MGNFVSIAHGQLAHWEGGLLKTGVVTVGASTTQFTSESHVNKAFNFFVPRILEFTSGDNIGEQRLVDSYLFIPGTPDTQIFTFSVFTPFPFTIDPGDTYKIYPEGNDGTDDNDRADAIAPIYHRVWAWRNDPTQLGKQIRRKFSNRNALILPSDASTREVIITHVSVATSLSYLFASAADQGSSLLGTLVADWISQDALLPSGTTFDDALWYNVWKMETNGEVAGMLEGCAPASRLYVPPRIPLAPNRRGIWTRPVGIFNTHEALGFERIMDYDPRLDERIELSKGETAEIWLQQGNLNMATEYDIVVKGWFRGTI